MTSDHPSDLPLLTPEERQAADEAHARDPWRDAGEVEIVEHADGTRTTGLYMGESSRQAYFTDTFANADGESRAAWASTWAPMLARMHRDSRAARIAARSPHTDISRAFDHVGPDGEIVHTVVTATGAIQSIGTAMRAVTMPRNWGRTEIDARALARVFRVPGRYLNLPPQSAAERRLESQIRRTQRRAARRARRAGRGR